MVAMVVYHTAWDLSALALAPVDVASPPWRLFARATAATFLLLVGIGLVLAHRREVRPRAFAFRLARIAAAALAVTVGTYVAFPQSFVFFGILHNIALSSLLALPLARLGPVPAAAAAIAFWAAPTLLAGPAFDARPLAALGLGTWLPDTNDWVPVFPWTGFVFAGMAVGPLVPRRSRPAPAGPRGALARAAAALGRHSLAIYLVHQPVIFGALWAVRAVLGPNPAAEALPFMTNCVASCRTVVASERLCRTVCGCTVEGLRREGLWPAILAGRASGAEMTRAQGLARACRKASVDDGGDPDPAEP